MGGRELPPEPPQKLNLQDNLVPHVVRSLELARDEAYRLGQPAVEPHNIVVAMFREEPHNLLYQLWEIGVDIPRLRNTLTPRLVLPQSTAIPEIPLSAQTVAALDAARELAEAGTGGVITTMHVLDALLRLDDGEIAGALDVAPEALERLRQRYAGKLE